MNSNNPTATVRCPYCVFQSDDCPGWWGLAYVRPMWPSHHDDESILRVYMRQVRQLELGTLAPMMTHTVKALLEHSPDCLPRSQNHHTRQRPKRVPISRGSYIGKERESATRRSSVQAICRFDSTGSLTACCVAESARKRPRIFVLSLLKFLHFG